MPDDTGGTGGQPEEPSTNQVLPENHLQQIRKHLRQMEEHQRQMREKLHRLDEHLRWLQKEAQRTKDNGF